MSERQPAAEPSPDKRREARLVLIRHGESIWNGRGRVQGQLGTGLSATGRKQAEAVAAQLLATYPNPAKVFSSDLERVVQTAEPYLSRTGHTRGRRRNDGARRRSAPAGRSGPN